MLALRGGFYVTPNAAYERNTIVGESSANTTRWQKLGTDNTEGTQTAKTTPGAYYYYILRTPVVVITMDENIVIV